MDFDNTFTTDQLYSKHHTWLRGWFRARLSCSEQAADLVQDTFVRVLLRQEEIRIKPLQEPRAFLKVIANGLLVDHFRRKAVEQAFLEALALLPEPEVISSEDREILLETLQQIDSILDNLPSPVRQAFLLSQIDGLKYAEIAEQMNLSVRTIKRYMQQAFRACLMVLI